MYNLTFYFKQSGVVSHGGQHLNTTLNEALRYIDAYKRGYFNNVELIFDLSPVNLK
jgi:hypothetical protein